MKKHLERKVKAGKSKPRLKDVDPDVLPAAWSILRWYVIFSLYEYSSLVTCPQGVWPHVRRTLKLLLREKKKSKTWVGSVNTSTMMSLT
jgi:hypothetical protein